jgi:hypothetical protein
MIVIDETVFPPDIKAIKTIRVAIATDANGKQGVMALHFIVDGARCARWLTTRASIIHVSELRSANSN